ncbi:MAG: hypothetical protein II119_04100 [Bacilli bacterium]|nr:hypothetical protein [Bacilli bacterium]
MNINDMNFINSEAYKNFIKINSSTGGLRVRAYAASQAVPISGLKVVVTTTIENNNVTFFEGYTNESGITDKIILPAPKLNNDNLVAPNATKYIITTTYNNKKQVYEVNMYENVCVIQNVNVVPNMMEDI